MVIRCVFAQPAYDVFNHDNRVVDNEPHGGRHSSESHDVEAHVENIEQQDGGGQYTRHHDGRNQRDLQITQEKEQDENGKNNSNEYRIAHAARRGDNQLALIVPIGNLHTRRQLVTKFGQLGFDLQGDLDRVAARLLMDLENHRVMAIGGHADPLGRCPFADRSDVVEPNQATGP